MSKSDADRRRYPRSRRGVPVVTDESSPGILNHVDNISANGILCHTVKPVPLMTKLAIVVDLPEPENFRVNAEGVVVRCEPDEQGDDRFKVAILFTQIDDEAHEAVRRFVQADLARAEG